MQETKGRLKFTQCSKQVWVLSLCSRLLQKNGFSVLTLAAFRGCYKQRLLAPLVNKKGISHITSIFQGDNGEGLKISLTFQNSRTRCQVWSLTFLSNKPYFIFKPVCFTKPRGRKFWGIKDSNLLLNSILETGQWFLSGISSWAKNPHPNTHNISATFILKLLIHNLSTDWNYCFIKKKLKLPADRLKTKRCSAIHLNHLKKSLFLMLNFIALHTPNCCPKPQILWTLQSHFLSILCVKMTETHALKMSYFIFCASSMKT